LKKLLQKQKIRLYLGIDPTGAKLTLGHSVVLRKLQQFALLGHEVILLIGGGTVKIGDPTGKDITRPELTDEQIQANFKTWKAQASKILDFSKIKIKNNADWLDKLNYSQIIKLMAKVTVLQLLERDMFQTRIKAGKPIHAHEIMYPIMQGYDSVVMNVDLEIGGTDQTFNMMMGRTLQKVYNHHEKWVLTTPIINGTDGRKMSKSYNNYIALNENPIDMYGKLMKIDDKMIVEYFTVLTDVPITEINEIQQAMDNGVNPINFKKQLAFTITKMYHDLAQANKAQKHFERTVQGNQLPETMPEIKITQQTLSLGELLKKCLPEESNSHLRRLVEQGGVELMPTGEKPTNFWLKVNLSKIKTLRVGKRNYFKIVA
jgi:tyrosyl-tRNA synthetase